MKLYDKLVLIYFCFLTETPSNTITFDIPVLPVHENVKLVELRFLDYAWSRKRRRLTLRVRKGGKVIGKKIHKLKHSERGFVLSERIVELIRNLQGNVSVEVSSKDKGNNNVLAANARPILVLFSSDNGFMKSAIKSIQKDTLLDIENTNNNEVSKRTRRATNSEIKTSKRRKKRREKAWQKKDTTELCKMYDFNVNFDLIGWGPWIIHPKKFNARVCYGRCPEPISSDYSPSNHVMLQSLMRLKRPLAAPKPCCVPTKLRPLSMLYFEYDDIVVRHHEDMIADACGCQ